MLRSKLKRHFIRGGKGAKEMSNFKKWAMGNLGRTEKNSKHTDSWQKQTVTGGDSGESSLLTGSDSGSSSPFLAYAMRQLLRSSL
jgi:hypothetical protein